MATCKCGMPRGQRTFGGLGWFQSGFGVLHGGVCVSVCVKCEVGCGWTGWSDCGPLVVGAGGVVPVRDQGGGAGSAVNLKALLELSCHCVNGGIVKCPVRTTSYGYL